MSLQFIFGGSGSGKSTYVFERVIQRSMEEEKRNEGHIFSAIGGLWNSVNLETIGQFTGLTDKNGTKIFEGDIVDCWSEGVNAQGTVQQRRDGLWIIYPAWQKHIMWGLCPDEYSHTTVEVIGNIHNNPELIKT